jgi:hypothetical protein
MIITAKQYRLLKAVVNEEDYDYQNNVNEFDILFKKNLVIRFQDIVQPNENTLSAIEEYERYRQSVERDEKNIRLSEEANTKSDKSNHIAIGSLVVGIIATIISIIAIIIAA